MDGLTLSAVTMTGGIIPMLIAATPSLLATKWGDVSPAGWGAVAYSGLLALVVAYLFWYRGLRVLGPTRTGIYLNIQPAVALMVAWIFLNEVPTVWQGVGMLTIVSGIFLTRT